MLEGYSRHNQFKHSLEAFHEQDPHLATLAKLEYQHSSNWWQALNPKAPGIYILTGGRQVGKSTSCKLLISHCLEQHTFATDNMIYLPCDEIFDAKDFSARLRFFLEQTNDKPFLLMIDEVTFVKSWERVIKSLADEGWFTKGLCILTGSDSLILKEAAMSFPGRRGEASKIDFHVYPLTFAEYVLLVQPDDNDRDLQTLFNNYLLSGGYLRAINDIASKGSVTPATFQTYEQWIRGDFLKQGKNEHYLLSILQALFTIGPSQISYSSLTQKIGEIGKDTCIDYCQLLERMDVQINLQAIDLNRKQGSPKKARKFHFADPFIYHTIYQWLTREGYLDNIDYTSAMVEATVANHCHRKDKTFYFKGKGEVDVIMSHQNQLHAIEVKWANQLRSSDLKTLKQFKHSTIVTKHGPEGYIENIKAIPIYDFLYSL